jgi:hypothetical protein
MVFVTATMLRKAMDGIGCNTELVNEIFCTLSNAEIKQMQEAYEKSSDSRLVSNPAQLSRLLVVMFCRAIDSDLSSVASTRDSS